MERRAEQRANQVPCPFAQNRRGFLSLTKKSKGFSYRTGWEGYPGGGVVEAVRLPHRHTGRPVSDDNDGHTYAHSLEHYARPHAWPKPPAGRETSAVGSEARAARTRRAVASWGASLAIAAGPARVTCPHKNRKEVIGGMQWHAGAGLTIPQKHRKISPPDALSRLVFPLVVLLRHVYTSAHLPCSVTHPHASNCEYPFLPDLSLPCPLQILPLTPNRRSL